MSQTPDVDLVANALGIRPAEIASTAFTENGVEVVTESDGVTYVFVGATEKSGIEGAELMYLRPPHENYRGSFPVLFDVDGTRLAGPRPPKQAATVPPAAPAPETAGALVDDADAGRPLDPAADPAEVASHVPHDPAAGGPAPETGPAAGAVDLGLSVNEILAAVGDDAELAAATLQAERDRAAATKKGKPRATLVAGLEAITGAGS